MGKRMMITALTFLALVAGCTSGGASQRRTDADPPQAASGRNVTGSDAEVKPQPGLQTVADVVEMLQTRGLRAGTNGEKIKELFGAVDAEVVLADGLPIQVYILADAATVTRGFELASNPQADTISWAVEPRFVKLDNLLITVAAPDSAVADRIVAALGGGGEVPLAVAEQVLTLPDGTQLSRTGTVDLPGLASVHLETIGVSAGGTNPVGEAVGNHVVELRQEAVTLPVGSATLAFVVRGEPAAANSQAQSRELWLVAVRPYPNSGMRLAYTIVGRVTGAEADAKAQLLELAKGWRVPSD